MMIKKQIANKLKDLDPNMFDDDWPCNFNNCNAKCNICGAQSVFMVDFSLFNLTYWDWKRNFKKNHNNCKGRTGGSTLHYFR